MSLVVVGLILNWAMISLAHLHFRRCMAQQGRKTVFPALLYPYGNYLCIVVLFGILGVMATPTLGMGRAVIALPLWILLVYVWYRLAKTGHVPHRK